MKKDTFLFKKTAKLDDTTAFILAADYNKQGKFACIQNISAVDVTTSPARIDLGFLRGTDFICLESFTAPAAGFTVNRGTEVWSYIDDMPAVRVITGVAGDQIELVIAGYILYNDNGE